MLVKGHLVEVRGNSFKRVTSKPEFKFQLYFLPAVQPWMSHLLSGPHFLISKLYLLLRISAGLFASMAHRSPCRNGDWGTDGGSPSRT